MTVRIGFLIIALAAGLLAIALPLLLKWLERRTGFAYRRSELSTIVASDTGVVPPFLLRDPALGIRGKPDYVLELGVGRQRRLVPVEVKPTRRSTRLYHTDRVQLGAYLIGLRGSVGDRAASFGYVRYSSDTFQVALTSELENEVRRIVEAIRRGRESATMRRNHASAARCIACGIRSNCNESLAR